MASRFPIARPIVGGLVAALCLFVSVTARAESLGPPPEPIKEWKTLAEYVAMNRDDQRQLIWNTRRALMRKLAYTDFPRAECISDLFNFDTDTGQKQFYNLKGFLKEAQQDGLFPGWKAQQVASYVMKTHMCPEATAKATTPTR